MVTIPWPRLGFVRGVFLANHLARYNSYSTLSWRLPVSFWNHAYHHIIIPIISLLFEQESRERTAWAATTNTRLYLSVTTAMAQSRSTENCSSLLWSCPRAYNLNNVDAPSLIFLVDSYWQWLKWSCKAGGGSPDEVRLEQTEYPFHAQLIWRYLGIK